MSKQAYGQKEHKPFIYGYDKKRKVLFVADHYSTEKYELATLGFEEFLEAYEMTYWDKWDRNLFVSSKWDVWEQQAIYMARVKPFKYEFNIDWFKLQLKDYLDSTYRLNSIAVVTEGGF